MGLFCIVVVFGEGFCDDEFGHIDFVLEEVGDGFFDVSEERKVSGSFMKVGEKNSLLLGTFDVSIDENFAETGLNHILY